MPAPREDVTELPGFSGDLGNATLGPTGRPVTDFKLPKKLPRQPLPAAGSRVGGGGLFGTPLLSSLMLEYGGWVQRNA